MIKCPRCNKEKAIFDTILGILPCEFCQAKDDELDKIVEALQKKPDPILENNKKFLR